MANKKIDKKKLKDPKTYPSTTSKLFKDLKKEINHTELIGLNKANLTGLSSYGKKTSDVSQDILDMFPDINLAVEIMTSLIIAPNDMVNDKLKYNIKRLKLPLDVRGEINMLVEEYCETEYKIVDKLDDIISESLYTKGAYIELNLPPKNISDLLKTQRRKDSGKFTSGLESNLEDFKKRGFLNKEYNDNYLSITSSPEQLAKPLLRDMELKAGAESYLNINSSNKLTAGLEDLFLSDGGIATIDTNGMGTDKLIIMKMEAHNVIPLTTKSDLSKHYGYFILLNEDNNPLGNGVTPYNITDDLGNPTSQAGSIINRVNETLTSSSGTKAPELKNMTEFRESMLEAKLNDYLKNSDYSKLVDKRFPMEESLLETVADHIISKSKINIIFLPAEMVSYYAINHRANGTGESLLERISILAAMRATILYTNIISFIKSSLTTTDVKIELDEDDTNYRKTAEILMANVIANRQISIPDRMMSARDFASWSNNLGYSFNIKHPAYPDINIDIDEVTTEINPIDNELREIVDKQIFAALYITPEIIDNAYNSADFAAEIIQNNIILSKRVRKLQGKYDRLITKDLKKKLKLDGNFKLKLTELLTPHLSKIKTYIRREKILADNAQLKKAPSEAVIEMLVNMVINNIEVSLIKPEVTESNTTLLDNYDSYKSKLADVLDDVFSTEYIDEDLLGEHGDIDQMKDVVTTMLLRQHILDNNLIDGLSDLFKMDNVSGESKTTIFKEFNEFVTSFNAMAISFGKENIKVKEKADKLAERANIEESDNEEPVDNEEPADNVEAPEEDVGEVPEEPINEEI